LPGDLELPAIQDLELDLDLPFLRVNASESSAQLSRKCTEDASILLRGSGHTGIETRRVEPFSELVLTGIGDIFIQQGNQSSLEVVADQNLLPYLTTHVESGQLIVGITENVCNLQTEIGIRYNITVRELDLLHVIGAGAIHIDRLQTEELVVQLDGSAEITITGLEVDTLKIDLNGAGSLELAGRAQNQIVNLNGFGQYLAGQLESNWADIQLNGTGNIKVWTVDDLQLELNGSGTISFYGDPSLSTSTSGLAGIEQLGAK
jgi:hypothetical protein